MSIFPFITPEIPEERSSELPMFREYAYDFGNNCLLTRNGNTYLVEGNAALRIWIYKALTTERYRYLAYSRRFGSEIDTLTGQSANTQVIYSEVKRFIIEALMVNPYIKELSNFRFEKNGGSMTAEFDCTTVYGKDTISQIMEGVSG